MLNKSFYLTFLIFLTFIIIITPYILMFNNGVSNNQAVWGAFGDYLGGVINPILSFITIIILLKGYTQQQNEMKEIIKENTKNNLIKSLEIINQELLSFYESSTFVRLKRNYTYTEILETILKYLSHKNDKKNIDQNNAAQIVMNQTVQNNTNIHLFIETLQNMKFKLLMKKFRIGLQIARQLEEIESNNAFAQLFLTTNVLIIEINELNENILTA